MNFFDGWALRHKICFPVLIVLLSFSGNCGPEEAHAKSAKVRVGDKFPNFSLNENGKPNKVNAAAMSGKVAVIDFWASDCQPCREAVPELNSLLKELTGKPVVFIGINVDENPKYTQAFLDEFKPRYLLLDDRKHSFIRTMGVEAMPTTYVVDRKGKVRFINKGFRTGDIDKIKKAVSESLAKN